MKEVLKIIGLSILYASTCIIIVLGAVSAIYLNIFERDKERKRRNEPKIQQADKKGNK